MYPFQRFGPSGFILNLVQIVSHAESGKLLIVGRPDRTAEGQTRTAYRQNRIANCQDQDTLMSNSDGSTSEPGPIPEVSYVTARKIMRMGSSNLFERVSNSH